jgi:hypothetical protein
MNRFLYKPADGNHDTMESSKSLLWQRNASLAAFLEGHSRLILWLLLGIAGGVYCFLSFLDVGNIVGKFFVEDYFYYLKVAENAVNGKPVSFDGLNVTNGFHPLWMLVLTFLQVIVPTGSRLVVNLGIVVCGLFHLITAYLIYRVITSFDHPGAALAAVFFWLFNYHIFGLALGGLETSLYGMCIAGIIYLYVRNRTTLRFGTGVFLGCLCALATLSRFDFILCVGVISLDRIWIHRKQEIGMWIKELAGIIIPFVLILLPWFLWSWRSSHTLLPLSNQALMLTHKPPLTGEHFFMDCFIRLRFALKWFSRIVPMYLRIPGGFPELSLILLALLSTCAVLLGRRKLGTFHGLWVFGVWCVLHFSYYFLFAIPLVRYMYPLWIFGTIAGTLILGEFVRSSPRRHFMHIGVVCLMLLCFVGIMGKSRVTWREGTVAHLYHNQHETMYGRAVPWIRENTAPEETVGSFNAGIYGYYSGRRVINLDGVINNNALQALREKRLVEYLWKNEIDYLIDWENSITSYFTKFSGKDDFRKSLALLHVIEHPTGPGKGRKLQFFRILPSLFDGR